MDAHALACLEFERIRELLAGFAMTQLGRTLAGRVTPVARADLVQRWLNQVEELRRLSEQRGLPPLAGISDVREIVQRCAPPLRVGAEEMARVRQTLAGTHAVCQYLADLPSDLPELCHLAGRIADFGWLAGRISGVIDDRAQVRDDASPKLERIRREIEQASAQIDGTVAGLLRDPAIRRLLQYPNATFHNDRIVLPLRTEYRGRLAGIIHRTSDSGATVYVEPAEVVELNNQIANLRLEEQEEVNRLLWELAHEVHLNQREILRTLDALAILDLVTAKLRFAREFGLCCPQLSTDGILRIRQARHPLLADLARRRQAEGQPPLQVVPVDYRLGEDFDLLIITGPNTGGKTVTLKTIGLINLMVQAGIPVPVAEGSVVGLFNDVLIDVGDEQSLQQSLSTFSAHMKQLLQMLRRAGPRTLVLIDELGAGTDPDEGAALGKALLDEFLRLQARCVVTTHLAALKAYALTRPRAENACVEFDPQTLQPTYELRIGEPGSSNAIEVAQHLGMPKRLVIAARRNLSRRARALKAALKDTAEVKRQAEAARQAAEAAKVEADRAQEEAKRVRVQLQRQQQEFRTWVQRVVHLRPGDPVRVRNFDRDGKVVRVRLDQQRAEVDVGAFSVEVPLSELLPPETPAPPPRPEATPAPRAEPKRKRLRPASAPQSAEPAQPTSAAEPAAAPSRREANLLPLSEAQIANLAPGDRVYVRRLAREGEFVRVKPGKQVAVVTVGLLEVEVPFEGLALRARSVQPRPGRPKSGQTPPKPAGDAAQPQPVESATAFDACSQVAAESAQAPPEPPAPERQAD